MSDLDRSVLARTEAEQADRAYNDAITELDHAVIPPEDTVGPIVPWPDAVLPPPAGPHKPWLRVIHRWLAPGFARQRTLDNHDVEAVEALAGHDRAIAFARFQHALIIFLQKITAFVESKDRLVAATAAARLDEHEQRLNQLPDIQTQLAVLQRATQMLTRSPVRLRAALRRDPRRSSPGTLSRRRRVVSRQPAVSRQNPFEPLEPRRLQVRRL